MKSKQTEDQTHRIALFNAMFIINQTRMDKFAEGFILSTLPVYFSLNIKGPKNNCGYSCHNDMIFCSQIDNSDLSLTFSGTHGMHQTGMKAEISSCKNTDALPSFLTQRHVSFAKYKKKQGFSVNDHSLNYLNVHVRHLVCHVPFQIMRFTDASTDDTYPQMLDCCRYQLIFSQVARLSY